MHTKEKRSDEEFEHLFGQAFALEAMVTHLIWTWAKDRPHPESALADFFRPIEAGMSKIASAQSQENAAMSAARATVRGVALELQRTLRE